MNSFTEVSIPEGPGSVSGAPNLPEGFADTFTSRYIDTGDVRLHAVIGGDGPPLLLVHGWPETWYAWRLLMPALARDFTVIAVDQRGIGLSDKPVGRVRHRHPRRRPGQADGRARPRAVRRGRPRHRLRDQLRAWPPTTPTGSTASRSPRSPGPRRRPSHRPRSSLRAINNKLWHIPFNRVDTLPEQLISGREDIYFGYEFAIQGGDLPDDLVDYYVGLVSNPDSLRGSLGFYRAFDATLAQNDDRIEPAADDARPRDRRSG